MPNPAAPANEGGWTAYDDQLTRSSDRGSVGKRDLGGLTSHDRGVRKFGIATGTAPKYASAPMDSSGSPADSRPFEEGAAQPGPRADAADSSGSSPPAVAGGVSAPRGRVIAVLRVAMGIVVALFVGVTIYRFSLRWESGQVELRYGWLGASTLVLVGSSFLQAMGWHGVLVRMAAKPVPLLPLFKVYMLGQLARYTPGKVGLPLVRIAGAPSLGLSAMLVGSSVGIEVLSWLSVGALVGMGSLTLIGEKAGIVGQFVGRWGGACLALILVGIVILNRVDRRRFPRFLGKLLRIEGQGPLLPGIVLGYQVLSWSGWLLHGTLLVVGVGGDWWTAWANAGAFVLAPIAGFLVLVAPGGLGVREAMLSLVLAPSIGPSRALGAALLARGSTIAADLIAFGITYAVRRQRSR